MSVPGGDADPRVATWDAEADDFDLAADHGLRDPAVRRAWRALLLERLPAPPARVADLGCGTGTLSVLLAEAGFAVDGVDLSPRMVARAERKAAAFPAVSLSRGDVADPPLPAASYDVVLCRHVLWALPDPAEALRRWVRLLVPAGRLVLVEGRWWNGGGLGAEETVGLVERLGREATLTRLPEAVYWGHEIADDRYVVTSGPSGPAG